MEIFLTWLIVALLGFFLILPYLRIRTSLLDDLDKEETYVFGFITWFLWPFTIPVAFLIIILRSCVRVCAKAIEKIEIAMEKKPESPPVKPEPPAVDAARSGYRNVEYRREH